MVLNALNGRKSEILDIFLSAAVAVVAYRVPAICNHLGRQRLKARTGCMQTRCLCTMGGDDRHKAARDGLGNAGAPLDNGRYFRSMRLFKGSSTAQPAPSMILTKLSGVDCTDFAAK